MIEATGGSTRFLNDGRICLANNVAHAERCLRGIAFGGKSWLFAGPDFGCGGECAAAMYTLIVTAKLNDVDPQAWLADFLA